MKRNNVRALRYFLPFIIGTILSTCVLATEPWQRVKRDLLTNFDNMYNPCVVKTDGDYPFKMWFFGWATGMGNPHVPGCDAVYHARSRDLLNWQVLGENGWDGSMNPDLWIPVLHAGDQWYEAWHAGDPSVVHKDGKFFMAYSATSKPFGDVAGYPATIIQCVMGATSDDGIHWQKTDRPLLIRSEDRFPPEPDPKRIGDFHRPCLRWEDGRWKLWFDYWLPGKGVCLGYSENRSKLSKQGKFEIQHDLRQPLLANWPNPEIVRIGRKYHSFADPHGYPIQPGQSGWMSRQLREAVSDDGIHWRKLDFISPDNDADACHVPQTFLHETNDKKWLYLFYATQIGYSKNDGQYHYQYDRIRAMRREIVN